MNDLIDVDVNNTELSDENDLLDKTENFTKTIHQLKSDKKRIEEEFGVQRARMKELFMQKEEELKKQLTDQNHLKSEIDRLQAELNDTRSQLTVTELNFQSKLEDQKSKSCEELSSLQRIITETIEEIGKYENEIKRLHFTNEKLVSEINELKANMNYRSNNTNSSGNTGADMPPLLAVPSTVISSIARTVKSQISTQLGGSDSSSHNSNTGNSHHHSAAMDHHQTSSKGSVDSLEECMRKAQEDAEVLRSVVVPLEEEIEALKDKLRVMDEELNVFRRKQTENDKENSKHMLPHTAAEPSNAVEHEGYNKHENSNRYDVASVNDISQIPEIKDINEIMATQIGMEGKFTPIPCTNCLNYETQLINAQQKIGDLEKHIAGLERYKQELNKETAFRKQMEETWNEKKEEYKEQVSTLQIKIKKAEETLRELHTTFTNTSLEFTQELERLRREREETQIQLNRLQEENDDLLRRYSKHSEQLQNEPINIPDNIQDLQEMVLNYQEELIATKVSKEVADDQISSLQGRVTELVKQVEVLKDIRTESNKLQRDLDALNGTNYSVELLENRQLSALEIRQFRSQINNALQNKRKIDNTIHELRTRVSSMQTELNNSETVQKDFVLLSQSLQQELERIRAVDSQVRWEHDDDINECPRCKSGFSVSKKKQHCRHCGRVFCSPCLSHTVYSGPNNRPSQVCDVCHTLLVRHTAPYFSTSVLPHSS